MHAGLNGSLRIVCNEIGLDEPFTGQAMDPRTSSSITKFRKGRSLRLLIACLLLYLSICAVMFFVQRSLLYIPSHEDQLTALRPWQHGGETIGFSSEVSTPHTVWLMMHGNAGQAAMRAYVVPHIGDEDSLYVLEYPGYGSRRGRPGREAFNQAAGQAYRLLREKFPSSKIGVIGESIGSGPACALASESQPPDKIVLVVPFDTLEQVVNRQYFWLPVRVLLLDQWNNIAALKNYRGPVDIYGARDDEIIPIHHARRLAQQIPNARFIEIPGAHNDWSMHEMVKIRFSDPR